MAPKSLRNFSQAGDVTERVSTDRFDFHILMQGIFGDIK